ncbi:MAG: pyrimidine dimer DNA glycosylase/endonuclease V [Nanoarchaeota archaeon]|nr:pyrimidine dimer DNA glycosylase/endonuclease V [Nanoarchaeota archaeon]
MVRINLIAPSKLADQHLVAEYNEILMLLGYVRKHPEKKDIPTEYCLGIGHIRFFKDKLVYLQKRHELIKTEMRARGFSPTKNISLSGFPSYLKTSWCPLAGDVEIIKRRISEKLLKKPDYYRYHSEPRPVSFFLGLLEN